MQSIRALASFPTVVNEKAARVVAAFVATLDEDFAAADTRFDELLIAVVSNPAFAYRREDG